MNATEPEEKSSPAQETPAPGARIASLPPARRRALVILAFSAVLILGAGGAVRMLIERAVRVDQVEAAASAALGRPVRAGSIEVSAIHGLVMTDVLIFDTSGTRPGSPAPGGAGIDTARAMFTARTIRVRPSWWELIQGNFHVAHIRVLDAEVHLNRDSGYDSDDHAAWNFFRLASELSARPGPAGPPPYLSASNLTLVVAAPGNCFDAWRIGAQKANWSPEKNSGECVIDKFNTEPCRIGAMFRSGIDRAELDVEFENFPAAVASILDQRERSSRIAARYTGINGRLTAAWTPSDTNPSARIGVETGVNSTHPAFSGHGLITVEGSLNGKTLSVALPGQGAVRMEDFSVQAVAGRYDLATSSWSADVTNMKIGPRGTARAHPLRIGAQLSGTGGSARGKVEWEGEIEALLAMLPASATGDAARFKPRGGSAGHALINSRDGATEISVTARGMSIRIPSALSATEKSPLPDNAELNEIRGRIGLAGSSLTLDSLAIQYLGDPLMISGVMKTSRRDTASSYDLTLTSPGFTVASVPGILPTDIRLDGKVATDLHLTPRRISGRVQFLGNNMEISTRDKSDTTSAAEPAGDGSDASERSARVRLTGGGVSFGTGASARLDALTLERVVAEIGSGSAIASGEIRGLTGETRMRVRLELQNADMNALSEASRMPLEFSGAKLRGGIVDGTVAIDGFLKAPIVEGGITLRHAAMDYMGSSLTEIEGPVKFDSVTFRTPGLTARSGEGSVRIVGYHTPVESKFSIALSGANAAILTPAVATVYPDVALAGPVDAELVVSMRRNVPSAEGTMTFRGTDITGRDDLAIRGLAGSIELHADRVVAKNLAATYLGAPASFNGVIPRADTGRFALDVRIGKAKLEHFAKFAPEGFVTNGSAEAIDVRVEGLRTSPRVTGSVKLTGTTVKTPFLAATLSDVRGDASFTPDSFMTHGLSFKTTSATEGAPERNPSTVEVTGGVDRFDNPIFRHVRVTSRNARLDDLLNLLPDDVKPLPKGAALGGEVQIDEVTIDGPLENARWTGAIVLKNGVGQLPGLKSGISGIEGALKFGEGKAKAEGLKGRIGATDVRIEGEIDLAKPYGMHMKLAMKDADIAELFGTIPKSDGWKGLDFKGRATMTASIHFANNRLKLDGTFLDGSAEGFGMPFSDMSGSYKYDSDNDVVTLSNLNAGWAGGRTSEGSMKILLAESPVAFEARGAVAGVRLDEVLKLSGFQSSGYSGLVDGSMSASGRFGLKQSVNGSGSFVIRKARFEKLAALDAISRALRLDFFTKSTYESAKGSFSIEKGVVKTAEPDHFRMMGSSFTIELRGYTSLEGECAYNFACGMQAGLVGNVLTRLQLGKFFAVSGDGGIIRTSGTISGRIENPTVKSDLGILNLFN
ncbi:MAG: AsmA-like C-terminal region-containing protein [Candidatus Hydrogenedentota bacterium]